MEAIAAVTEQHSGVSRATGNAGRGVIVIPFEPHHLNEIDIHDKDSPDTFVMQPSYGKALAIDGKAFTCTVEGKPVMCAGIVELWEGRAMAWAFMAQTSGRVMLSLTRKVREFLDLQPHRRIEMDVVSTFAAGRRWAELLGFNYESHKPAYYPDGSAADTFVRIR